MIPFAFEEPDHGTKAQEKGSVLRHRTAIRRTDLSKPIRIALECGLITPTSSVFDFGCGRGDDLRALRLRGITCSGWDPRHRPDGDRVPADVVNMGFVANVIEDPAERSLALCEAWSLTQRVLLVSARLEVEARGLKATPYGDGVLTSKGTFQKFFAHGELGAWIDSVLSVKCVAAAPGVFLVFRDDTLRLSFGASQYRRVARVPHQRLSDSLFELHKELLRPLMEFCARRGRPPETDELENATEVCAAFASLPRACVVVRRATGAEEWDAIAEERSQDLLVYLALARFGGRARISELPTDLQRDVKAFAGTYARACDQADKLLFASGRIAAIDAACKGALYGKLMPDALYVHTSAMSRLDPVLRIYEGCARRYIGVVDGANMIKLHRQKPQVSYLCYPRFDEDPHPALLGSLVVPLQTLDVQYRDYAHSENPFILHRKEDFVGPEYPFRAKFERLTKQEEKWGLYENPYRVGTRRGWQEVLDAKGVRLQGHRLCRLSRPASPCGDAPMEQDDSNEAASDSEHQ